jgi:YD repeat-containing protein
LNYEFDDQGRLTRTYTGDGKAIIDTRYSYDALGRLLTATSVEQFDSPIHLGQATTYAYDERGLLDYLTLPSGIVTDYTVDEMGRITDLVHYSPEPTPGSPEAVGNDPASILDNGKLAEFHYTYLADGNRTLTHES